MKIIKKLLALNIILVFCALALSSCNESGKIWTKYTSESFLLTARYEMGGEQIYFRAEVNRSDGGSSAEVRFSSPEVLRGAVGVIDSERCVINLDGIELDGESAERLLNIPRRLIFSEASALGRAEIDGKKLIFAEVEGGKIYFDTELYKPQFAELCGVRCDIVKFSPK